MTRLRSLVFHLVFWGGTVPIVLGIIVASWVAPGAVVGGSRRWGHWFAWTTRHLLGIRLVMRGTPPQGAALVAPKHQSFYEAVMLLHIFERPAVVMKEELLRLPLWGRLARAQGSIGVVRARRGGALKRMVEQAEAARDAGRPIVIFPEGTRIPAGLAPPVRSGLFALAQATGLPATPVALHTAHVWPAAAPPRAGTVVLAFGPPVHAGDDRQSFDAAVHAAINADPATAPVA